MSNPIGQPNHINQTPSNRLILPEKKQGEEVNVNKNKELKAQEKIKPLDIKESSKTQNVMIIAVKVSLVALAAIVLLAAAAALMSVAWPLFAAGGLSIAGGVVLGGGALGLVGGAIGCPFLGLDEKERTNDVTPMFKVTENNARDCLIYLGKALGMGALIGATGALIVPGIAGAIVVGGVFAVALANGVGH